MTVWASLRPRLSTWIDDVAAGLTLLGTMLRRSHRVELVEQADGSFLVADMSKQPAERADGPSLRIDESGIAGPISPQTRSLLARSTIDVMLAPSRFIFRSLELPQGARQFLDGVVRSQIDRLTPWSPNEAAFGWSEPTDVGNGQIAITVAATARSLVAPIARAAMAARADQVRMSTRVGEGETPVISVFAQDIGGGNGGRGLLRGLVAGLALSGLAFVISLGAWLIVGSGDGARIANLQNRIAERRSELMNRRGPAAEEALKALQARKWTDSFRGHGSRSAVEDTARRRAPERIAHRERQGAGRRISRRRACAHSINRAVAAFHPGYVLRAYGEGSRRR